MKILITGGAGFIGSHLSQLCIDNGHEVTVIDNLITGNKRNVQALLDQKKFTFIESDIVTYSFSENDVFDVIFHMASPASPVQYQMHALETMRTNSQGTDNILQLATKIGAKVLIASTSEVYGDPLEHPQKETYWGNVNPNGIRSCYDEAKRYSEALAFSYIRKHNTDVRIVRIFNTYGPHMEVNDGRVVSNFVTQALQGKPLTIYGNGSQTRSFCFVSDLIKGLYTFATKDGLQGEVINLGNPNEMTIKQIAEIVIRKVESARGIVYEPIDSDDPKRRNPDISKATSILSWEPMVSFDEGLDKTIEYFKTVL